MANREHRKSMLMFRSYLKNWRSPFPLALIKLFENLPSKLFPRRRSESYTCRKPSETNLKKTTPRSPYLNLEPMMDCKTLKKTSETNLKVTLSRQHLSKRSDVNITKSNTNCMNVKGAHMINANCRTNSCDMARSYHKNDFCCCKRPTRKFLNLSHAGDPLSRQNKQSSNGSIRSQSSLKKRLGVKSRKGSIIDARQKIIQKKRKNVVDARDILAKMAKKQDARSKILKIREQRKGENVLNGNVRAIGSSILQKTDRNGKISLITNKSKQNPHDLNVAVRQQLGLIPSTRPPQMKKIITKRPMSISSKDSFNSFTPPVIRKTILNDMEYPPGPAHHPPSSVNYTYESSDTYRWYRPDIPPQHLVVSAMDRRQIKADRAIINPTSDWRGYPPAPQRIPMRTPSAYVDLDAVDDDEDMPLVSPLKTSRISNVHSRLDSSPVHSQSHGILSQAKAKVVVPVGHRIVVSNLQPTVTEDDIRELFEDIGQLLVARLVRPGTAEVIYKSLKDAQKAVDTYHNRQLDGQPMKCLLVNKRPLNNPTAPAITNTLSPSKSNSDGSLLGRKSSSNINSSKLVPDLSTIHKVLFQRNN